MTYLKPILMLSLIASTIYATSTMAANVTNLSKERFEQVGKDAFWVISVSCDDNNSDRTIQRHADADQWCPKGNSALCSEDKAQTAKNACGTTYTEQLVANAQKKDDEKEQQRRQQAAVDAEAREKAAAEQAIREAELALQVKIKIDEELISIEQKRLELVQEELKIDRRIAEIEEILKTEGDDEEEEI